MLKQHITLSNRTSSAAVKTSNQKQKKKKKKKNVLEIEQGKELKRNKK